MKKSILIGVLAALMLFAFTACDSGASNIGYVTKVEATTTKEYVDFGTVVYDPADFTFTGITTTGEKVNLTSNQFTYAEGSTIDGDEENTKVVTFNWGSTKVQAKAEVTVYPVEKIEVAAGTAPVLYYTVTSGTYYDADPEDPQADTDYNAIDPVGLVLTLTYDTDKTMEVVVDKDTTGLTYQFGKIEAGEFKAESNATTVPATAGEYAIQVAYDSLKDTYDVTVEDNRVASTALVVDEDYVLYTNGTDIIVDGKATSADKLDGTKVFVTKAMTNGQVLKAADAEVAWGTVQATVSEAASGAAVDIVVDVNKGTTTTIYAKYVGKNVTTDYKRDVYEAKFTPITEAITGATIVADDVELVLGTYSSEKPVVCGQSTGNNFQGVTVTPVANSGSTQSAAAFNNETVADTVTWNIGTPSIPEGKVAGDSIALTVTVYNGTTKIAEQTVIADLVTTLTTKD